MQIDIEKSDICAILIVIKQGMVIIMIDNFVKWLENFAPHLISAAIILAVGTVVTKIVIKIMSKGRMSKRLEPTAQSFIRSIIKTSLYVIVIIMTLSALQVPMSSIIAAVGAAGVAIALALQNSLSNVAGGFLLMLNRPFKCGDFVEINGVSGNVDAITILYTRLLTIDNKAVIIPNGTATNATITNYTQEECRRLEMHFSIAYDADFDKAREILLETIGSNPLALNAPQPPMIVMSEHADSAIKIMVRVWVKSENYWDLNFELLEDVKHNFDLNGIEIPYNKLDVHIKP